ncbi:MAG: Cyanophage [Bacteroidota bacterium]|jgi:hypothetical protein
MGVTQKLGTIPLAIFTDASNNVGIGGSPSGSFKFEVTGTGRITGALTANARIQAQGSNGAGSAQGGFLINYNTNNTSSRSWLINNDLNVFGDFAISQSTTQTGLTFNTRFYINPSGNVGIGTETPSAILDVRGASIYMNISDTTDSRYINFGNWVAGRSTMEIGNGDLFIKTQTSNSVAFGTANTERLRITSGGYTQITSTNSYASTSSTAHAIVSNRNGDNVLYLIHSGNSTPYGPYIWFTNVAPNNTNNYFLAGADSVNDKFLIYSNGTFGSRTGTYGSIISDIKYKQDITDANSQWNDIKNLRVVNFKYKEDVINEGDNALRQIGFIAQEVEAVSPNLVYEAGQKDKEETWKSVKTSIIHLKAVKALQEAMARIEELEVKVSALQNKS